MLKKQKRLVKTFAPLSDDYVDACFHIPFEEQEESRTWQSIPEGQAMAAARYAGEIEKAIDLATWTLAPHRGILQFKAHNKCKTHTPNTQPQWVRYGTVWEVVDA